MKTKILDVYYSSCRKHSSNSGFTLIELSLVLIIIGLIVVSVIIGSDMIEAAKIRQLISQLENYDKSATTFRSKFRALPGDFANMEANTTSTEVVNGDGNGRVGNDATPSISGEVNQFFVHLSAKNLLHVVYEDCGACDGGGSDPYAVLNTHIPKLAIDAGVVGFHKPDLAFTYFIGIKLVPDSDTVQGNAEDTLSPENALSFDTKIDDGEPDTGRVTAITSVNTMALDTGDCTAVDGGYELTTEKACRLAVRGNL